MARNIILHIQWRALLSLHVVTVAILGAAGWLHGALLFFASSPKRL